jgi:hypothetical protein
MANPPLARLKRLRAKPLYGIKKSNIDWFSDRRRPALANKMLWLQYTPHDMPVHRAFDFFPDLDRTDPRHWRILITYLSMALFPNAKGGARDNTISENAKLLNLCNALDEKFKSNDTAMLKAVMKLHYKQYNPKRRLEISKEFKSELRSLRRRLAAAREHQKDVERLSALTRTK